MQRPQHTCQDRRQEKRTRNGPGHNREQNRNGCEEKKEEPTGRLSGSHSPKASRRIRIDHGLWSEHEPNNHHFAVGADLDDGNPADQLQDAGVARLDYALGSACAIRTIQL